MRKRSGMCGSSTTTTSVRTSRSAWRHRGTGSNSPVKSRHDRSSSQRRILSVRCHPQRRDASRRRGRSVSLRRTTRSGCGSPVRTSRSSARAGWCRSITVVCSSPPMLAGTTPPSRRPGCTGVRGKEPQQRPTASVVTVTRKVDSSGNVCFAGASYRAGNKFRRRQVQVAVIGDQLEISIGEQLIRRHKIKHDRTRNTAPSPTPAADHAGSTPPEPNPTCQAGTEVTASSGYRGLTETSRAVLVSPCRPTRSCSVAPKGAVPSRSNPSSEPGGLARTVRNRLS